MEMCACVLWLMGRGIHHSFSKKEECVGTFVSLSFSLSFPNMHRTRIIHTHLRTYTNTHRIHHYIHTPILQQTAALEAKRAEESEKGRNSSCYPFQVSVVCVCLREGWSACICECVSVCMWRMGRRAGGVGVAAAAATCSR